MIRVVLDTNIVVSALLTPAGLTAEALLICTTEPDVRLCLSANIYSEYEEVIRRPKFKRGELEIDGILSAIRTNCIWVKPTEVLRVCLDPDDDIFLECAQAVEAHYLVTGNTRHFPESWRQTQVVTVRQFVEDLTDTRM